MVIPEVLAGEMRTVRSIRDVRARMLRPRQRGKSPAKAQEVDRKKAMPRRRACAVKLVLGALAIDQLIGSVFLSGPAPKAPPPIGAADYRAWAAEEAENQDYWMGLKFSGTPLYSNVDWAKQRRNLPSVFGNARVLWAYVEPATTWALSQALAGALDRARITGDYSDVDRLVAQIDLTRQWDGSYGPNITPENAASAVLAGDGTAPMTGPVTHVVRPMAIGYDDNAWLGLDFMQAYWQTGDTKYLDRARAISDLFLRSMDPQTGGLLEFNDGNNSENAVSTGPAIELLVSYYQVSHDAKYLEAAEKMYAFVDRYCKDSAGLYHGGYDKVTHVAEPIDPTQNFAPYDTGAMIGANLSLYQVTGDASYLKAAQRAARAAIAKWGASSGNGEPRNHSSGRTGFENTRPRYNAIFFRELIKLYEVAPDPSYVEALNSYAQYLWSERDPDGLFTKNGPGPSSYYPAGYDLTDQGAAEQVFALVELLGSPSADVEGIG